MKILYFANSHIPSTSANSIHVMKMCAAFAGLGHKVTLALNGKAPDWTRSQKEKRTVYASYGVEEIFEIQYVSNGTGRLRAAKFFVNAIRYIRRSKPEFVYGRNELAVFAAAISGVPAALELHNTVSTRVWYIRAVVRLLPFVRSFKGTTVISSQLKKAVIEEVPQLTRKLLVVAHDGADPSVSVEAKVRHANQNLQVGYFGHLYPGKGMERIADIAPHLPEVDFQIFGGTESDIQLWRKKHLSPNIYLHGHLPHSQLPALQASMDILLAPYQKKVSVHGGQGDVSKYMSPLKLFEYMAAGKPIICSDLPVLREILDERCAMLVPCDDTNAWVHAIQSLKSRERREIIGKVAKERFLAKYTWHQRGKFLVKTYAQFL